MLTKRAEVEHGDHVRPLGFGRARLPNGRYDASVVEWPVRGFHMVVVVEVPY